MNIENIIIYFKKQPLLVLTVSTLSCAGIGFWLEYSLLSNFGLNIGTFASIDYFLLAGITSPQVLIVFLALVVSNYLKMKILTGILPVNASNEHIHKFWQQVIFLAIIGVAFSVIYNNSLKKFDEITQSPKQFAEVLLRTDNQPLSDKVNDLTLITATDAFMIFYQHSTSGVIATPVENISAVRIVTSQTSG
jgi:hypothetical protein